MVSRLHKGWFPRTSSTQSLFHNHRSLFQQRSKLPASYGRSDNSLMMRLSFDAKNVPPESLPREQLVAEPSSAHLQPLPSVWEIPGSSEPPRYPRIFHSGASAEFLASGTLVGGLLVVFETLRRVAREGK